MTSKIPKISVIIPIYNAQEYLQRCLESVVNQTLCDIEIICVDDCSNDASAEIIAAYAKKFPQVIARYLKKNHGESGARNVGIAVARGEYLAFVDNDDELDLNFYEKLYDQAKSNDADISKGQTIEIAYNGNKHVIKQLRASDDKLLFINYWWSAIFKRSLIIENNISFSIQHPLGGDLLFLNQAVMAARNLQLVENVYYYYFRREDSGDSKILSEEKIKSASNIYEMVTDNINAKALVSDAVYNFIFHHFIIGCFYLALKSSDNKMKQHCAKAAVRIFEKSRQKESLHINFANTAPHLFTMLINQDDDAVAELFVKCQSRSELIVLGLRARLKNKS